MDRHDDSLSAQVERWLAANHQTQADLARACGVTRQRIGQVLDGTAVPSLALAVRLEDVTGIPARRWAA